MMAKKVMWLQDTNNAKRQRDTRKRCQMDHKHISVLLSVYTTPGSVAQNSGTLCSQPTI